MFIRVFHVGKSARTEQIPGSRLGPLRACFNSDVLADDASHLKELERRVLSADVRQLSEEVKEERNMHHKDEPVMLNPEIPTVSVDERLLRDQRGDPERDRALIERRVEKNRNDRGSEIRRFQAVEENRSETGALREDVERLRSTVGEKASAADVATVARLKEAEASSERERAQ